MINNLTNLNPLGDSIINGGIFENNFTNGNFSNIPEYITNNQTILLYIKL